jgi:hypothetical protein
MVNYELLTQPQKIERLKVECPKLVEQSLAFYEQAKSYHQSNDQEEEDEGKRALLLAQVQLQHIQELIIQRQTKADFDSLREKTNQLEIQIKQERSLLLQIEKSLGGVLGKTPTQPVK